MRRSLYVLLALASSLILTSCGELTETLLPEDQKDAQVSEPAALFDVINGNIEGKELNPNFHFLPPLVDQLERSGVPDDNLKPVVTICAWEPPSEQGSEGSCVDNPAPNTPSDPYPDPAVFTMESEDSDFAVSLKEGSGYSASWKTDRYPAPAEQIFRITVTVFDQVLGWLEVRAYDQQEYNSYKNTGDPDGFPVISTNGTTNVQFLIEEGALEYAFCQATGVEDCDIQLLSANDPTPQCLRVFDNPEQLSLAELGSQTCIAGQNAVLEQGQDEFVVIMTLEEVGGNGGDVVYQGGGTLPIPEDWQLPYFPDIKTLPEGILFDGGVEVTICQAEEFVPDGLHPFLRPFIILANGEVFLPPPEDFYRTDQSEDPEDWELCTIPAGEHAHMASADAAGSPGLLDRIAGGFSRVKEFLLPKPLHARRRLHGGLNTTVWKSPGDDGDQVSAQAAAMESGPAGFFLVEETVDDTGPLEMGALVDMDPMNSFASNPPEHVVVGSPATFDVLAFTYDLNDGPGEPFLIELPITVVAEHRENGSIITGEASYDALNRYSVTLFEVGENEEAPDLGAYDVTITLDGRVIGEEPLVIEVVPVAPSPENSFFEVSDSEAGSPTIVTVTVLDESLNFYLAGALYDPNVQIDVFPVLEGGGKGPSVLEAPIQAVDLEIVDGSEVYDGYYVGSWTPAAFGDFWIVVTMGGEIIGEKRITTDPWPADPAQSSISVRDGAQVDATSTVTVAVINTAGNPYFYGGSGDTRPIEVKFTVLAEDGSSEGTYLASDNDPQDGLGLFTGTYEPKTPGTHSISATIDGEPITTVVDDEIITLVVTSEVSPIRGNLIVQVQMDPGGSHTAPAGKLPVELYQLSQDGGVTLYGTGLTEADATGAVGTAVFADAPFGDYVAHLPKRDFDMDFYYDGSEASYDRPSEGNDAMTRAFPHDEVGETVTFNARTLDIPVGSQVWRVGSVQEIDNGSSVVPVNGNGNLYQYIDSGRSWKSAQNQVRDEVLYGVSGYLATVTNFIGTEVDEPTNLAENVHIQGFFNNHPDLCPNEADSKKCKVRGWLGLTDEASEGTFVWVKGGEAEWFNWPGGNSIGDIPETRKPENDDHVEIGPDGFWNVINGANSTNDGYFVEWDVIWPTFGYLGG
jgi:hypothetical protein